MTDTSHRTPTGVQDASPIGLTFNPLADVQGRRTRLRRSPLRSGGAGPENEIAAETAISPNTTGATP